MNTHQINHTAQRLDRPRVLWLARELPFPLDSGDRIYSACLARSLAEAGVDLTLAGLSPAGGASPPADWPINWVTVPGRPHSPLRALFSSMPMVAAAHATPAYRAALESLARKRWDAVVVDQYGMGWALALFLAQRRHQHGPVLVHVAHDHEASVCEALYRQFSGSPLKRAALWQNQLKVRSFERSLVKSVDLVTAITEDDAERFARDVPRLRTVVLKPGYGGVESQRAALGPALRRRVVMVGSFRWTAKQENLRRFVTVADPVFARHGIELHVIGAMPAAFADELRTHSPFTRLHGFVEDIEPHFAAARIAVVPEVIGGGFKLKFLDYIFGRVPVATLSHAAAGLPAEIREAMLCGDDLEQLVQLIADHIDDFELLNRLQTEALAAAQTLFHWRDRGTALLHAIRGAPLAGRAALAAQATRQPAHSR